MILTYCLSHLAQNKYQKLPLHELVSHTSILSPYLILPIFVKPSRNLFLAVHFIFLNHMKKPQIFHADLAVKSSCPTLKQTHQLSPESTRLASRNTRSRYSHRPLVFDIPETPLGGRH